MSRIVVAAIVGAALAGVGISLACSQELSQSECHRQAIERYGCCPVCDVDCRAALDQECAEVHDAAFEQGGLGDADDPDVSGASSSGDDADAPPPPTVW